MRFFEEYETEQQLSKKQYEKELKLYQLMLTLLQRELRKLNIPIILLFEGWDASGKGGAIKRVTEKMDPRGLKVYPIGAPTDDELKRNYLWRFWSRLPRRGEIVVFDRSWYGRVLVERVEGFATEAEWQRAYHEINEFENTLVSDNTILLKFFMHVTEDEQLKRFQDRQNDPFKTWKITDEDWRNRAKWKQYEEAFIETFQKTSTKNCKWNIINSNQKRYARIEVMKLIVRAIENYCGVDTANLFPVQTKH